VRARHIRTTGLALLLLGSTAAVSTVWAQSSDEDGGIQLRFNLGLGVGTQSNRTLDEEDPGSTTQAFTDLSLALTSVTRTQELSFDISSRLRGIDSPAALGLDSGFTDSTVNLGYSRFGATSTLDLSASLREYDLSDTVLVEDDLGDITLDNDDGTGRTGTLNARYDWNQDARVRYGTFATYTETKFSGGSAETIDGDTVNDSNRLTLGADVTLDLNRATSLKVALSYNTFDEVGSATEDTWSLDNALTVNRPTGDLVFNFGVDDTVEGTRLSSSVGHTYLLPQATLYGEIGLTREAEGSTIVTGAFNAEYPLPRGALTFGFSRGVSSDNLENEERVNTSADLGYEISLNALSSIDFGAQLSHVEETATDDVFLDGELSMTFTRTLTRDWDMNLGLRQRYSDDEDVGSANSSEIFFSIRREYLTRF